jgi:hypothetical protein
MDFFCLYDEEVVFAAVYLVLMEKIKNLGFENYKNDPSNGFK